VVLPASLQLICTSAASPIRNNLNLIRTVKLTDSCCYARTLLNRELTRRSEKSKPLMDADLRR
jgi:hypothetical protein